MAFSKRRIRGNDGSSGSAFSVFAKLPKALEAEYYAHRIEEAEAAKRAKAEKVEKRAGRLGLPEATILAMRALKEYQHWTVKQVAVAYGMAYSRAYSICNYQVGGGKVPVPADVPDDAVPPMIPDKRFSGAKVKPEPRLMMANTYASLEEVRRAKAYDPETEVGENG